ncbi:transcriptional regulator, TetR family [Micromonospora pattaloongensis]|uniref:Transcriptional regulator, TetR family n=1 Tax=Micromonospora pattaloongensis TaxID=405436 RepID=A0A1H3LME5_9ACTN|nr:TetR/AcrR family transcriptional regulator [Micromonospora pattaloongensis]SDY65480.1 transcriptional regulator, TetR family [Micromonospora pattaloongensis]
MPRAGLSPGAVVDAALAVIDERGPEALTLAAVAARTGVATPSLYVHVRNLAELRRLVAQRVLTEMAERLGAAVMGRGRDEAVAALFHAWRAYVLAHPARYAAVPAQPRTDPEVAAAAAGLMEVVLAVLRGYGLTGSDAIHAARRLRATAHGFAALEAAGGFGLPEDLDTSYQQVIDMVVASLRGTAAAT